MTRVARFFVTLCLLANFFSHPLWAAEALAGIALHGNPKYPANFTHFDYANPDAPKGGEFREAAMGTFETLNPFTLKGIAAGGANIVFETLMSQSMDEAYSQYGWIAESVSVAPDRKWVSYKLRPEARFNDGSPITPDDVIFSFETLRDKGHPLYRSYFKDVAKAEVVGTDTVKFTFGDTSNAELSMMMGQIPVFSKKFWQGKDFAATTFEPILGSGPYVVDQVTPGRTVTYKRVKNWWAKDLPVNKGRFNFDTLRVDYYRDTTVELEGFFAGRFDFRLENSSKFWATEYNTPAIKNHLIKKEEIKNELPAGMQGYIMNIRHDIFKDRRVRLALNYAFDFEWSNKTIAYGAYERTASYFENSELAAKGLPSPDELKILEAYRGKVPDEVFTEEFKLPRTDGSGDNRDNLKHAIELLHEAGWNIKNGVLVNDKNQPFTFEIITAENLFERWTQPFLRNLERLGIKATFRIVDTSQYQKRMDDFDYDMTVFVFGQPLSPGNEELNYWSSKMANVKGSGNKIGISDPVVDDILQKLLHVSTREELITICRVLDRVLLWNYYVIPHWHIGTYRVAYWDMFGKPTLNPKYGLDPESLWWVDQNKSKSILDNQQRNR